MKTHTMKNLLLQLPACILLLFLAVGCKQPSVAYHIGVSQCSEDIWRHKFNKELEIGSYVFDHVELEILSAGDDDQKQIEQIQHFIDEKVDLLIVAPNSASHITATLDRAYENGIPVILFDRRTNSQHFTAYMGADNYAIGQTMGRLIATQMNGQGTLVEITGLKGSSPAMERHRGFAEALRNYPQIHVVSSELGDWTTESGEKAMEEVLEKYNGRIDCLFGHNDRLAMGARKVAMAHGMDHIVYYGVDALPTPGGGIELVQKGILKATYLYPTQGIELMRLAKKILEGEAYDRTNVLQSAVVDRGNADLLLMQYREQERATKDLEFLDTKVDTYFSQVNMQQKVIVCFLILLAVILLLVLWVYRSYLVKSRLNEELSQVNGQLEQRNAELHELYTQLEDMADARLVYITNVGHRLRTPLTLISGPAERLHADTTLQGEQREMADMMHRNLKDLLQLVDEILDFRNIESGSSADIATLPSPEAAPDAPTETADEAAETTEDDRPEVLVVDDNADVRTLLKNILKEHYHVTLAENGESGLREARRLVPDLVVSDVMMPVMDGLEMCSEIKRDTVTCHIPVLMLTARSLEEQRVEGYACGADAYLTKPFSAHVLLARIDNLLATRRTLRKAFAENVAHSGKSPAGNVAANSAPENAFVARLRDIIQQHLSDSAFSVERIGEEIGMSRVQLYRKVKAMTGMSPVELLRKSRVERGRHLIETTDLSISEIAYKVGFSAPSYFNKCFKDEYGTSPGEHRK